MDYKYTVSVAVPVYNAKSYIQQCLDSLVNQTLNRMELLVIDDGSNDGTEDILDIYAERYENVTVIHQPCISQANAVNRAWRMAQGEYIAECDADDFASILMYQRLYEAATSPLLNRKADVVRCGFFGVWDDGHLQPNPLNAPDDMWVVDPHELPPEKMGYVFGKMVLLPAGIYRREFIEENNLYWREGGQNYEDTAVSFKIRMAAHDYRFVNDILYYYRRGNPNSGSSTIKDEFAICEQYDEIERYCTEHGYPFMEYMNVRRYYDYMWSLSRTPEERQHDFLMKCMEDFRKHPANGKYFNTREDFANYCAIKYGVWLETGVKIQ